MTLESQLSSSTKYAYMYNWGKGSEPRTSEVNASSVCHQPFWPNPPPPPQ